MDKETFFNLSDLDKLKFLVESSLEDHVGYKSDFWRGSAHMAEHVLKAIDDVKQIKKNDRQTSV